MSYEPIFLLLLPSFRCQCLEVPFVGRSHTLAEQPSKVFGKLTWAESLVEGTDDLDTGFDLAWRLELAEAFIASGNDLGEVLAEANCSNLLEKKVFRAAEEAAVRRRLMNAVFFFKVESSDLPTEKRSAWMPIWSAGWVDDLRSSISTYPSRRPMRARLMREGSPEAS